MRSQSMNRTDDKNEEKERARQAFNHHEPYYDKNGMQRWQRQPETTTAYAETPIPARRSTVQQMVCGTPSSTALPNSLYGKLPGSQQAHRRHLKPTKSQQQGPLTTSQRSRHPRAAKEARRDTRGNMFHIYMFHIYICIYV